MLYADIAYLISEAATVNSVGDSIMTETKRMVFVEVKSVGLKRKVEAMAAGLNIEFKLILADVQEYQNEKLVEYRGVKYNVHSTYINDDQSVELTVGLYAAGGGI